MTYYHVYIETTDGETEETDFQREQLLRDIVKPFSQHRQFFCKGVIIEPDDILVIRIFETEQPSSEVVKRIRAERGTGAGFLGEIIASDFDLLEKGAKDVTREFLTVKAEKRRKRISKKKAPATPSNNVFIVHGRDHKPMKELKAMLKEFGLKPMVLHEQPSGSRTIVENLEKCAKVVGYAFVILTPDDRGGSFKGKMPILGGFTLENSDFRARQNVILEFGFFIGKLGRDRVCCLYKGNVELPSDMHGIVYIPFNVSINEVRDKIIKELREADYEIKT